MTARKVGVAQRALDTAERRHVAAVAHEAAALETLTKAEHDVGDAPESTTTLRAWRSACEARDLAALVVASAARGVDSARADLRAAECDAARRALSVALPRAARADLFDRCAEHVTTIARLDAEPIADVLAMADDEAARAALAARATADTARAMAARAVHALVTAQHEACGLVASACVTLSEPVPRLDRVPEGALRALAAVEALLLTWQGDDMSDLGARLGAIVAPHVGYTATPIGAGGAPAPAAPTGSARTLDGLSDWARTCLRLGDARDALAIVQERHATPAERESRERNRVIALEGLRRMTAA